MKSHHTTITLVLVLIAACTAISGVTASSGDLYVSDNDAIHKFAPDGTHTIFATLSRPRGLAFDKFGKLFAGALDTAFHDNQGRILSFSLDGSSTTFVTGLIGPEGITFHNLTGNLFANVGSAGNTFTAFTVLKITPVGSAKTLATISDSTEFSHIPFSLVFDSEHNLFAADEFANAIFMITSGGKVATYASVPSVQALAFDGDGNLYVGDGGPVNGGSGNITKIAPDGTQSTFTTGVGDVRGLAFGASGNLFATGHGDNVVYKITPNGTVTIFATGLNVPQFLAFQP